jgi:hypothetical protein
MMGLVAGGVDNGKGGGSWCSSELESESFWSIFSELVWIDSSLIKKYI